MNDTILRFGHPATVIAEYPHWFVLLRPEQPTLGSLVLVATLALVVYFVVGARDFWNSQIELLLGSGTTLGTGSNQLNISKRKGERFHNSEGKAVDYIWLFGPSSLGCRRRSG